MAASGSIKNVTLTNIGQTTGCQAGRAILVGNTDAGRAAQSVTIENNTVSDYNKNGIDVRGNVDAKIIGNTVTGTGRSTTSPRTASSSYGATTRSRRSRATRSAGTSTRPTDTVGHRDPRHRDATVTMTKKNTLSGNEVTSSTTAGTIGGKKYSA